MTAYMRFRSTGVTTRRWAEGAERRERDLVPLAPREGTERAEGPAGRPSGCCIYPPIAPLGTSAGRRTKRNKLSFRVRRKRMTGSAVGSRQGGIKKQTRLLVCTVAASRILAVTKYMTTRRLADPVICSRHAHHCIFSSAINCANSAVFRRPANSRPCIKSFLSLNPSSRALRRCSMARSFIPAWAKSLARQ